MTVRHQVVLDRLGFLSSSGVYEPGCVSEIYTVLAHNPVVLSKDGSVVPLVYTKFHWLYSVVLSIVFYANPLLSFFVLLFFYPIMNPVQRGTTRPSKEVKLSIGGIV